MEQRVLFTITPRYNGWQVRDELRNRDWFTSRQEAMASADLLAHARHCLTGVPTGVTVDDAEGNRILYTEHG